jgi:hypothetical protein
MRQLDDAFEHWLAGCKIIYGLGDVDYGMLLFWSCIGLSMGVAAFAFWDLLCRDHLGYSPLDRYPSLQNFVLVLTVLDFLAAVVFLVLLFGS